jgi:hypothetical protein
MSKMNWLAAATKSAAPVSAGTSNSRTTQLSSTTGARPDTFSIFNKSKVSSSSPAAAVL